MVKTMTDLQTMQAMLKRASIQFDVQDSGLVGEQLYIELTSSVDPISFKFDANGKLLDVDTIN